MLATQPIQPVSVQAGRPEILLVDDEAMVARGLARALKALRPTWRIHVAESGAAALCHLQRTPCDVLVTDLHMPGLDGLGLLSRVEREFPSVARLVHSSSVASPLGEDVLALASDALAKPARPTDVIRAIERALAARPD